jgi:hypothetical protein
VPTPALAGAEHMGLGSVIRLAVVVGWLALFVPHIVRYAAPGLGLTARDNAGGMLAANLGKVYLYELIRSTGGKLGTCRLSFERMEQGFKLETELRLDDLGRLAPGLALLPQLREAGAREVRILLSELLDGDQHLKSLTASGRALGMDLFADGRIGPDGLRGTYTFGDGIPATYHLPDIGADAGQGSDLALNLPPGLQPGDRFTTRLLSPDYAKMRLTATTAVFTALAHESLSTVAGARALLKVEMQVDALVVSHLWCDGNGTVYRSRQQDGGMELRLMQIREVGGRILWPPGAATQ